MNALHILADQWRADAALLRKYGETRAASACEVHAEQLEGAWDLWLGECLTLEQAAMESGYSVDHLGRQVRCGVIQNAGRTNAPRIRRVDLPRKPGRGSGEQPVEPLFSKLQIARSIANSGNGGSDG